MSHTKEIWRVTELDRVIADRMEKVNDDYFIADCFGPDAKDNARRIVACVNACKGISTKTLEHANAHREKLNGINTAYEIAAKQRDTCRELCGELLQTLRHLEGAANDIQCSRASMALGAIAAITKAEQLLGENNAT